MKGCKMLKRTLLLLTLLSLLAQMAAASAEDKLKPYEIDEAYQVFSAILPSEWPWRIANAKRLAIRSETSTYEMCLRPEKEYEAIIGPAISDFVKQNQQAYLLQNKFHVEKPYDLIPASEYKSIFRNGLGGWSTFYKKYPDSGGSIELSAVGFNADKTIAVVYMGHSCGGLCGGGGFHVMQKKEEKWVALDWEGTRCHWVS